MSDTFKYTFWITFDAPPKHYPYKTPVPKITKGEPSVGRNQRAMKVVAELPATLFQTPTLTASIGVSGDVPMTAAQIDTETASEALKAALGVDIDLRVVKPTVDALAAETDSQGPLGGDFKNDVPL